MSEIDKIRINGIEYDLVQTKLKNSVNIGGVQFDASEDVNLPGVNITGNQNTTGSAQKLTTPRAISINGTSKNFDGSQNISFSAQDLNVSDSISSGSSTDIASSKAVQEAKNWAANWNNFSNVPNDLGTKNTASTGSRGWWKCGDTGLIIQWGEDTFSSSKRKTVTFPIAFPNALRNVMAIDTVYVDSDAHNFITTLHTTWTNSQVRFATNGASIGQFSWIAIGY